MIKHKSFERRPTQPNFSPYYHDLIHYFQGGKTPHAVKHVTYMGHLQNTLLKTMKEPTMHTDMDLSEAHTHTRQLHYICSFSYQL